MRLLAWFFLLMPLLYADTLSLDEVFDKMIQSSGGVTALKQLKHYEQQWSRNGSTLEREVRLPYKLIEKLDQQGHTTLLALNDGHLRYEKAGKTLKTDDLQRDAMRLELMRLYTPALLQKQCNVEMHETPQFYIIDFSNGMVLSHFYVDKKRFLIQKVLGEIRGSHFKADVELGAYQNTQGVLLPSTEHYHDTQDHDYLQHLESTRFFKK